MKFKCSRASLSEAIGYVSRAVSQKSTIAALEGIKVQINNDSVDLTGYNLELGIRTSVIAETEGSGEFVMNSRLFSEFTRRMSGETIEFSINENLTVEISCDDTECSFQAISADEYPELPNVDAEKSFTVKQTLLRSMINQTSYAASVNESKPILTGELFEIQDNSFRMVAIDGYRLAIRTEPMECGEQYSFVVPKKALTEVSSLIREDSENECKIFTNNRHIIFEIDKIFVISRLLEGTFHNYRVSIPNECKTEVIISKREFSASLERCSLIIDEKNKMPIHCEVKDGAVRISCKTGIGRINDVIPADISGEELTIGFNNKLLIDGLKAAEGDKVRVRFNGPMKVIEMLPMEGDNYIFLVMPIQLKK